MDLNPTEEQQQLIDTFGAFYAKECPVERVRGAEPSGHDPELWTRLREVGALDMAVDEASGGWGASLLDLALVAEQHGRHLGPAPLIEAQVAARLLARVGGPAATDALGRAMGEGRLITVRAPSAERRTSRHGAPPEPSPTKSSSSTAIGCGA